MHSYLRSIGFRNIGRSEMKAIFRDAIKHPDHIDTALDSEGYEFTEIRKEIVPGMGLCFRGSEDDNGSFSMDYYFPYKEPDLLSTLTPVEVVKESDREGYLGICEEVRLGVDLIFYIQDVMDILESEQRKSKVVNFGGVALCGLASSGKILLPVMMTEMETQRAKKYNEKRWELISQAREGDQGAFEELTLDDMDIYNNITRRIESEDVMTIVKNYFMPSGIESDKYSVLGDIVEYRKIINHFTMEAVYMILLGCNDILFEVCINERDLLGEPMPGRRFKGDLWLQGKVKI